MTNPGLLRLAREARGLTQTRLAELAGVAQGTISRYEQALQEPAHEQLAAIARVLGVPEAFFGQDARAATVMYRTKSLRSAKLETTVRARLNLARIVVGNLLAEIDIDKPSRFPEIDQEYPSPEHAAAHLRRAWGIPPGPVSDLCALIEAAGGIVVRVDMGTDLVVAAYMHPLGDPIRWFFVNTRAVAGDRVRFALAHELGHAILHEGPLLPESGEAEQEAHRFAAAFLTPAPDVRSALPRGRLNVEDLLRLKIRFGVSMQSLISTAHSAGSVSAGERQRMFRLFSRNGWRVNEPGDVPVEHPFLLGEVLRVHRTDHGYTDDDLASIANVSVDVLADLLPEEFARGRPTLRVVSPMGDATPAIGR